MSCPDVPRPILSRDDPSVEPDEERPVPRNMKITQDILKKFGYTPGCAKCRKLSRNGYSHPGLHIHKIVASELRQQAVTDLVHRDRVERAEQRKMDFYAKEVERIDHARGAHWNRVTYVDHQLEREIPRSDPEGLESFKVFGIPNGLVESQNQDLSGEIPVPSADETLTHQETPCCAIRFDSSKFDFNSDLSRSLFKQVV